jgi:hypothetical protein
MMKKEKKISAPGGVLEGAERKAVYGEQTTTLTVRVPESKKQELKLVIQKHLIQWQTPLLFLITIIFCSICSYSQVPKKANTIVVNNVSLKEAMDTLLNHNFFFDKVDSNNQTLTTQPKKIKGLTYVFNIRVQDSIAYFSGRVNDNIKFMDIEPSYSEITNTGMKGSLIRDAFNYLDKLAHYFNKPVEYKIN